MLPNGTPFSYAYDGFGRRVQKVVGTTKTGYVYRDGLHLAAVLDDTGALISRFVYGSRSSTPDMIARCPSGLPGGLYDQDTGFVHSSVDRSP